MSSSVANLLLRAADAVSRLLHFLLTAPLVYVGFLPTPHPVTPSEECHVVITGASTGIGRDAARALRSAGFSVLAGVRKQADAESVRADGLKPLLIDVADDASVETASREVMSALATKPGARLVAVVANAGVVGMIGPVENMPVEEVRELFEVNVFGAFKTVKAFLPLLREAKGRIVLVGSAAGVQTSPALVPYCMTKHAIESLADGLRRELAPLGVTVSLLVPGPVITPIFDKTKSSKLAHESKVTTYRSTWDLVDTHLKLFPVFAIPTSFTSNAIVHAITAKYPLYRYRITWIVYYITEFLRMLPTQVEDATFYLMMSGKLKGI